MENSLMYNDYTHKHVFLYNQHIIIKSFHDLINDNYACMQVDLSGGYYDAGDNVKYGLPLAFTVTTLSWAALNFDKELRAARETDNVRDAIKWGTDYLLKCASRRNRLYVQVI